MILGPNFTPLTVSYPSVDKIPRNWINDPIKSQFKSNGYLQNFKEQFGNEESPHIIRNIQFQFGTINNKRAAQYYYNRKPARLVYSDDKDLFLDSLMNGHQTQVKFPPLTCNSPTARLLRELGLKYVISQLFGALNYVAFDEPQLEEVTPDLFVVANEEVGPLACVDPNCGPQKYSFEQALFIELKAYHDSSICAERELIQAYNYALKGGKALLITTGTLDTMDLLADHDTYQAFIEKANVKYRKLIKTIDMGQGQDAWDSRGIYISAPSKIKKFSKIQDKWSQLSFKRLTTPAEFMHFLTSSDMLGIVEPRALKELMIQRKLLSEATLMEHIQTAYLEEIMVDPTVLYPK